MAPTIFLADNYQKLCVWLIINVIIKNFIIFSRQFQEAIKEEEQNKSASICFWLRGMSSTSSTRPRRVLIPPPTNNDASFSPRRSNRIKVFVCFSYSLIKQQLSRYPSAGYPGWKIIKLSGGYPADIHRMSWWWRGCQKGPRTFHQSIDFHLIYVTYYVEGEKINKTHKNSIILP